MLAEDVSVFFDTAGFATQATLAGSPVQVILDTETVAELGGVLTQQPSALMRASQAPAAAAGQTLVAGATTYKVRQVQKQPPDGALVRLVLTRSA